MTNWQLQNAQQELARKRPHHGVQHIGDITVGVRPGQVWDEDPEPPAPTRTYRLTPLDQFDFSHLTTDAQRARLEHVLGKARAWLGAYQAQPGLSFVLCGPVGTGKTTIAENLMQVFRQVVQPVDADGQNDLGIEPTVILNGRLIEATRLMDILEDGMPLANAFVRERVIIVDDAGDEEIPFTNERTFPVKRQRRYGRFLDYCYRHGKHVIITSMVPLLIEQDDGKRALNGEFVDIFGQKAFSRLRQMAGGYMVDLTGLPDYRPNLLEVL